jgi:hydroxymethylpyrimidine pyrophosphatase-like HAD family hydrolase
MRIPFRDVLHAADMNDVRLLSMDFDGTLICGDKDSDYPAFPKQLVDALNTLRSNGVQLALNTGRTLASVESGLEFTGFPVRPDFALTTERDLYRWDGSSWEDFGDWNAHCEKRHTSLYSEAEHLLQEIEAFALNLPGTRLCRESDQFMGVITANMQDMDEVCAFINRCRAGFSEFSYQRNSIYLRFCHLDYNKGTVLAELQRLIGVLPEATFAVGDNFNDLPMLDPKVARYLACPSNAIPTVKSAVLSGSGFVAGQESGAGVFQALQHFFPQQLES